MCSQLPSMIKYTLLEQKIADLESRLRTTEKALQISQRRNEIAIELSDVTIFDYNIKTRKILTQPTDYQIFGMPGVLDSGIEEVINSGIIAERSKEDIRELYHKIDEGATSASTTIYANALDGSERTLALQMVSIFDKDGTPSYAVGVRKDITDQARYRREKEYGDLLASERTFIYEANVTQDRLIRQDDLWASNIALGNIRTFSGILKHMCEEYIFPDDIQLFTEKQSRKSVLKAFANGERIIGFEYRKNINGKDYQWYEVRGNLVQDEITKDINMRVYILNIDTRKRSELRSVAEHKQYELAIARSAIIYELNISKNFMRYVREDLSEKFELFSGEDFFENILPLILNAIHPEDRENISWLLSRANLLSAYASGKIDLSREYRRIAKNGQYYWFRCSLQFFKEQQTDETICYVYIEDINDDKQKELTLLYQAQHDTMTGFYNKKNIAEKVDAFLATPEGEIGLHAFFIIDIDYFKLVNDTFGHIFGDSVLSRTSTKISARFRKGDLFGRIGGDEFVVFMKNVINDAAAIHKAQELCDSVAEIYTHSGMEYKVTVSVGTALSNGANECFANLYRHSDAALYEAKEQGRNRFSIYHDGMASKA